MDFGADGVNLKRHTIKDGLLITFEGGEGVGKSTQAERLFRKLESFGIDTILAQEPGSSDLGNNIRRWIKRSNSSSPLAETLLFEAARAQMMFETVRPAMDQGKVVVLDRYIDSTLAYQGYGRNINLEIIKNIESIVCQGVSPDLTFFLEISPEESLFRRKNEIPDRIESEGIRFLEKVNEGFKLIAKQKNWKVISASQNIKTISNQIKETLLNNFSKKND